MIKISMTRRLSKNFIGYLMEVSIDGKKYDLNINFLIWAHIKPNEEIEFFLRPETTPTTLSGIRSPVTKRKAPKGFFRGHYAFIWKPKVEHVRDAINSISFPLNLKDNVELFEYCFNEPVCFSRAYNDRLKELKAYSISNEQEIYSAPRWCEVLQSSLKPISRIPKKTDRFFLDVFQRAIKKR